MGAALSHALSHLPGGKLCLAASLMIALCRRLPMYWQDFAKAWSTLQPAWPTDLNLWSPADLLAFPVPNSFSARFPTGVPFYQLFETTTGTVQVLSESALFC